MQFPNYRDGSIVNLMSSISMALGYNFGYQPLDELNPDELSKSKNVVLIVIDGLGYEWLIKNGTNSMLAQNVKTKITSVFPTSTAPCVTTFITALAPQQHAITGWYMYLKEIGMVVKSLPFTSRAGNASLGKTNLKIRDIYTKKPFFEKTNTYVIADKSIVNSDYTIATSARAKRIKYKNLSDMLNKTKRIALSGKKKKYMYVYWPKFDNLCHKYGTSHKKVLRHFREIDRNISLFLKSINGTNTTIIITADHGLLDGDESRVINMKDHPKLSECLTMPLTGESRAAYCYVRPLKNKQFKKYIKKYLKHACRIYKSEKLMNKKIFGFFEPAKALPDRIGDYIMLMKDNYIIKDSVLGEKEHKFIGHHGGLSKEELFVPLIVVKKYRKD